MKQHFLCKSTSLQKRNNQLAGGSIFALNPASSTWRRAARGRFSTSGSLGLLNHKIAPMTRIRKEKVRCFLKDAKHAPGVSFFNWCRIFLIGILILAFQHFFYSHPPPRAHPLYMLFRASLWRYLKNARNTKMR